VSGLINYAGSGPCSGSGSGSRCRLHGRGLNAVKPLTAGFSAYVWIDTVDTVDT